MASYLGGAAFMAALCAFCWWMPFQAGGSMILQLLLPAGPLVFGGLGAVCLYALVLDPPDFRADAQGLSGSNGVWVCSVTWEHVASLEIVTIYDVMGELALIQPRFKDVRGKTILFLNLSAINGCTPQACDCIVAFLRRACAEPKPAGTEL